MKLLLVTVIFALSISAVWFIFRKEKKTIPTPQGKEIRYVPIGDSYTIGQGLSASESFPQLLTDHLKENGYNVNLIVNPAQTGWTVQDAIDYELPTFIKSKPDFATLLIGANDYVQGIDEGRYRDRLVYLIDHMLGVIPDRKSLILITIPDFSVTKVGREYGDRSELSEGIARFNKIILEEGEKRGLAVIDITSLTQQMGSDSSLINSDNLHPSAKEYTLWEEKIYPQALEIVKTL